MMGEWASLPGHEAPGGVPPVEILLTFTLFSTKIERIFDLS
jgi:hypothetical protein